jgi:hypothetical protein
VTVELFSFLIQFIDMLISAIVSLVNIVRDLWRDILLGAALIAAALVILRLLSAFRSRRALVKGIRQAVKENGALMRASRPLWLSLLLNLSGYDFEIECRGVLYRIKLYPFNPMGRGVQLNSAKDTVVSLRGSSRRAMEGKRLRGFALKLDFDNSIRPGVVNVLVFSPSPLRLTERNELGKIWELDAENGAVFDGVYLFDGKVFLSRMTRLLDGYITSLRRSEDD